MHLCRVYINSSSLREKFIMRRSLFIFRAEPDLAVNPVIPHKIIEMGKILGKNWWKNPELPSRLFDGVRWVKVLRETLSNAS